ncbi:WecB/TagA/CpsF family glycosyltransferase [Lachnospiraceae bacterium ZAX-1]
MIKKIDILGIQIDNYSVNETMLLVENYLNATVMNTIEIISTEMIVLAKSDTTLKECIENLDLAIIGEKELLTEAKVASVSRIRETMNKDFFTEFMKRIIRNNKTVYLLCDTGAQTKQTESYLLTHYEKLIIVGSYSVEDCTGDIDTAINEMNIAAPDIILSLLPTPEQEYFLSENKGKIGAIIWLGLGQDYMRHKKMDRIRKIVKKCMNRSMLRHMMLKYKEENKM